MAVVKSPRETASVAYVAAKGPRIATAVGLALGMMGGPSRLDFRREDLGPACTVALHTSCHARREMGSHETSEALLESLAQVNVVEQARIEECCGFGGTFAIRYPDISEAIVSEKVAALKDTGAERVVSADCGCLFNITGRSAKQDEVAGRTTPSLPGEHLASFLWRRTSGEPS